MITVFSQGHKMAVQKEIIEDWQFNQLVNNEGINKALIVFAAKIGRRGNMDSVAHDKGNNRQKDDYAHHDNAPFD